MKDIDVLKREENLCNCIWEENYYQEKGNAYANLDHIHVCDFELINFQHCKNKKELKSWPKRNVKNTYLLLAKNVINIWNAAISVFIVVI